MKQCSSYALTRLHPLVLVDDRLPVGDAVAVAVLLPPGHRPRGHHEEEGEAADHSLQHAAIALLVRLCSILKMLSDSRPWVNDAVVD